MAAYLSPVFGAGAQLFNNQGVVLSGGKIYTYQAGTTTPLGTWTDSTQAVSNANPIILDSAGRLSSEIWLQGSSTYKFILTDSSDNVLGTWDNIAGLNDVTTSVTVSEWTATNLTPAYISSTSFSVSGNNTATFQINRRVKIVVSAGTVYGYVVSSTFSSPNTTVVIKPDSTVLDSGISSVNVGLCDSVNVSIPHQYLAANAPIGLTAAATTNIGAALSLSVSITGVTSITAFDNVIEGIYRFVFWDAATPIVYNATSMKLIASADRTNNVGDFSIFRSLGSGNWIEEVYQQRTDNILGNAPTATLASTVASGATAVTQSARDNSTKIATTAYVDQLNPDYQVFTGNGTWTKPAWCPANALVRVEMWGGGGGNTGSGVGSGGGSYNSKIFAASALGATETVVVGAGGTTTAGGVSSFGTHLYAYGGAASTATGGGGGGTLGVGGVPTGGAGYTTSDTGGSGGSASAGSASFIGGGGGGAGAGNAGGNSYYGGGGGGNATGGAGAGGISFMGGAGGAGNVAGSIPGGGGGGLAAGARGEVRVWILQ